MQHIRLRQQSVTGSLEDHLAFDQNDVVLGDLCHMLPVLVDDDCADARLGHQSAYAPNFKRNERCQTLGGFVQQQ